MSLNFRCLPPVALGKQTIVANGRTYSSTPGNFLDAPDLDAVVLAANSWIKICPSGPTTSRPTTNPNTSPPYVAAPGFHYYDTTISALIIFDGATWRSPAGASV